MVPTSDMIVTAAVDVTNNHGLSKSCRAVLDTGSSSNFITEEFAKKLRLPLRDCNIPVVAIDNTHTAANHLVTATIKSRINGYMKTLNFLTVKSIGNLHPTQPINRRFISIPKNVALADPAFDQPAPVQMLLSAGTTLSVLCQGQVTLNDPLDPDLVLQKSQFGWVIGGSALAGSSQTAKQCYIAQPVCDISSFWEVEDMPIPHCNFSQEELACENHFKTHTTRPNKERYVVALPFTQKRDNLGDSRSMVLKRFYSLERKFKKIPELEKQYTAVLQEYIDLGHMTEMTEDTPNEGFYLPHHAVFKTTSQTTKVRVVFDGSASSTTGVSLNDTLMIGPVIQDGIFPLLLRFRSHKYVLTGDIEKMYRQFLVRKEDRKYQKIFWRDEKGEIATYELNTVTFGTAPAPYLAVRCIHQLAEDEREEYPVASEIIKRDLYVDDLLTGTDSIEEALHTRDEITNMLKKAGLNIRQMAANDPRILQGLPEASVNLQLTIAENTTIKTLGIHWNSQQDTIVYTVKPIIIPRRVTKRNILSETAKIFDPLGLIGPVIVKAKLMVQRLWQEKRDWDESIPLSLQSEWINFASQLPLLNQLSCCRQAMSSKKQNTQIHGFCDASSQAYGACIYMRTQIDEEFHTQLLCAKSRVAPKKTTLTIPRLELCAALLLAELYTSVKQAINYELGTVYFWSDSMVALHWINTESHKLLPFVANRVSGIISKTDKGAWRHVSSGDNPADYISRGQLPDEFINNSTWKTGPSWLSQEENMWPESKLSIPREIPEQRKACCLLLTPIKNEFLERFSSFTLLRRVTAYCLRWKERVKKHGPLTSPELIAAHDRIVRLLQIECFPNEIRDLEKGDSVQHHSKLKNLDPFLDDHGLIRVGGRLKHASIPYAQQHPLILPKNHHVTTLIIRQEHYNNYHAGAQTTLYALRRCYWLINGRDAVRRIIRSCPRCREIKPPAVQAIMGNLPKVRLTEARPFYNVGVDYCGPFYIKEKKLRNRNRVKVWVAVFICMVVKAVHLEVVSDLTTEGFLAAFKRFIARRGKPLNVYSDNGSNFLGANNELKELYKFLQAEEHNDVMQRHLAEQGIAWHFTPPLSPHFGGLWEAGVKSFKHHLKRVVNDLLTYEQFETFAIEIEAILNSRPLTPISTDPNDLLVLTPGHLVIGDSLTSLPGPDFRNTPVNRLSAWQHIEKIKQDFWTRWHKEYINEQNVRNKWSKGSHNIREGTIVIMREEHLPPRQWALGGVIKIYPGDDGVVRVVLVKTARGDFDRSIRKLAPLLPDSESGESE